MSNLGEAYVTVRADTSRFATDLNQQINQTTQQVSEQARTMGAKFSDGMKGISDSLSKVQEKATATGRKLSMSLTLPLVGLGTAAFKSSSDFDKSMAQIVGLVGVAREEVDSWRKDVEKLGVTYGKSSKEAADALFFITSAGLRGKDAMDTLEASLRASATGLGDTATIADLATSAMNAYGSSVLSATGATDVMVATVREGKLEAGELAGAMGSVLPIASAMGVSFNEVGATFASLSRTGTNASQASTQLRGILSALLKPTKQAQDQLAELGLSAGGLRSQIQEEGLLAALTTLTDAFGDNEEAQAKVFGNVRALAGIMDLMGANVDGTRAIFESMTDVTGDSAKAFDVLSESTGFKMQKAFAEIRLSLKQFGDIIAPTVVKVAGAIGDLIAKFQSLSDETKQRIAIVAGVLAALGPGLLIIGKLAGLFSVLAGAIAFATGTIVALRGGVVASEAAMKAAAAITKIWTGVQAAFNAVMAANPIALAVLAVVGLVAAFVVAYKKSETFRDIVAAAMEKIREVVSTVVSAIVGYWSFVWEKAQPIIAAIRDGFEVAFRLIRGYVETLFRVWSTIFSYLWTVAKPIIEGVRIAFDIAFQLIKRYVLLMRDIWASVFRALSALARPVFDFLVRVGKQVFEFIGGLVQGFRDRFGGAFQKIGEIAKKVFEAIPKIVSSVINGIIGGIERLVNGAIGGLNKLIRGANALPFVSIAEVATVSFGRVSEAIAETTGATSENERMMRIYQARLAANQAGMRSFVMESKNLTQTTKDAGTAAEETGDKVEETGGKAKEAEEKIESFAKAFKEGLTDALKDAQKGLEAAWKEFNDFANNVSKRLRETFSFKDALDAGAETGKGFVNGLESMAARVVDYSNKIQQLLDAGLSEEALSLVLSAGTEAGSKIADQLIKGGSGAIERTNELVIAAKAAADKVGINAAERYYRSGVTFAEEVVKGLQTELDALTPKLMEKMDRIAAKMKRTVDVTVRITEVVSRVYAGAGANVPTVIPRMAEGGIVPSTAGGRLAVIGEAGAEAVIPLTRPARAMSLLEESGLADLIRTTTTPTGSVLTIQNATFASSTDADLVAQKVLSSLNVRNLA